MTYDSFEKDILNCFNKIIEKYNFVLIEDPDDAGWFLLKNKTCVLSLCFDRGEIKCLLKNCSYDFIDIKLLYSKVSDISLIPKTNDTWSPINQLNRYVFMIDNSNIGNLLCEYS